MPTPILKPLNTSATLFEVLQAGTWNGEWYEAGERILCGGVPRNGDPVVLVPSGRGRPVLGRRVGLGWTGASNEPCSPRRWRAAGVAQRIVRSATQLALPLAA